MTLMQRVRAGLVVTGISLGAGVALSSMTAAVSSATGAQLGWATSAGGNSRGFGVATDSQGDSYVTGEFSGTVTFGESEDHETVLRTVGGIDVFVAKYDRDGRLLWAKRAGGTVGDLGSGIATDHAGNSYVTGLFNGTATFGESEKNETELVAAGDDLSFFVAKYDGNGRLLWARQARGTAQGSGIATDGRGNSYVTGFFSGTAMFGEDENHETELVAAGDDVDIFVTKYDPDGRLEWAKRAGGSGQDEVNGIAMHGRGDSYVTGFFSGTAMFGEDEDHETELSAVGSTDVFVANYPRSEP